MVNAKRAFKKDPMESLSNLGKIPQDNRQDPKQSYKILQQIYGVLISSGNDPTVLSTSFGSYSILEDPIRYYRILWDGYGILEKHERTSQHSVKI